VSESSQQPTVLSILHQIQKLAGTACRVPQASDRVGFAFSSKDRPALTRQSLVTIDSEGGFDLIWNDGSNEAEGRDLPGSIPLQNARLVEVNHDVRGGPDGAICFGLQRLLDHGYDYVGLIENDVVLAPGWFRRLMNLFELAAADGVVCGAATIRSYRGRVIEHRSGYSLNWGTGAGMILFSRPAAEIILRQYPKLCMTRASMMHFYERLFRLDLRLADLSKPDGGGDAWLTLDWGYSPMLYAHGYASVGSIPSLAGDIGLPPGCEYLAYDYVPADRNNAGLVLCRSSRPLG